MIASKHRRFCLKSIRKQCFGESAFLPPSFLSFFLLAVIAHRIFVSEEKWALEVIKKHYAATIGAPMMTIAATLIVLTFRATSGPVELEVLGFKFKGSSGPVVMWMLVYLSMTVSVVALW